MMTKMAKEENGMADYCALRHIGGSLLRAIISGDHLHISEIADAACPVAGSQLFDVSS